jgi:curved DNA-binding protein CbpA
MNSGVEAFWNEVQSILSESPARTYYQLLGVDPAVAPAELADAFRLAVQRYHPDRHATETEPSRVYALTRLFARINEAYRVLSSAELRAAYDLSLTGAAPTFVAPADSGQRRYRETRDPMTEKARVLLQRGRELSAQGDHAAARAQLALALQFEKSSPALNAAFEDVNRLLADKNRKRT